MAELAPKSFWERPEGKTGLVFAAGGILGFVLIMIRWGTALVRAAENTFILGVYIAVACGIGYVLMDKRFRATVWYLYRGVMRFLTGLVIQLDPIGILKTYVDELKSNYEKMDKQLGLLRGSMRQLKQRIEENQSQAREAMEIATQAKKAGKKAQMMLKSRKAGRLQESTRTYEQLYNKMEMIYRVLSKMYDNCGYLIEDTEDQVTQKEIEWNTIRQANSAMKSAMSIVNGDKDKRAIFEEALEYMAVDLGNKIGEMERFMETSQNFMDGIDLENGVFEEKGLAMLEAWEQDADSWLLGDEKSKIITEAHKTGMVDADAISTLSTQQREAIRTNQYGHLFDMK